MKFSAINPNLKTKRLEKEVQSKDKSVMIQKESSLPNSILFENHYILGFPPKYGYWSIPQSTSE